MPTYDYDCDRCGPFSESHPIAEFDLPQPCPACGDSGAARADAARHRRRRCRTVERCDAVPRASGGCSCCAAPRRFSAEAV